MKHLILLLLFIPSLVQAQDYVFEQDGFGVNASKSIYFDMVDATDGYTAETGLSPTCNILYPGLTSYGSCPDSVIEIGSGTYRVRLSNGAEWESLGTGSLYITGTGARPARIKYTVVEDSNRFLRGASYVKFPNQLNATQQWNNPGVTITSNTTADYLGYTIADTMTGDGANTTHRSFAGSFNAPGGYRKYYGTVEARSGTINNLWVGDENWGVGLDINTSTGTLTPGTSIYLKGWKLEKISSTWWRVHWVYEVPPTDSSSIRLSLALGNGTVGTGPQSFATSGTMIVARAYLAPIEGVNQDLISDILPNLQSAASSTSVTLAASEIASSNVLKNREICFLPGYVATTGAKSFTVCSCVTSYDGSTKVATILPSTYTTLNNTWKYKLGGVCLNDVNATVTAMNANTVTASAIASNAITRAKIANDAIDGDVLAAGTITSSEIADNAITNAKLASGAISSTSFASGAINATAIASDAISSDKISTTAAQEIADTTLRRSSTNIEGSSSGDTLGYKSLYGVIAQQTHKTTTASGVQTVYRSNGTTTLNLRSYTSNPSAEPITGLD